jgi:serine/threonine protein kinase/WD40 repeat protein
MAFLRQRPDPTNAASHDAPLSTLVDEFVSRLEQGEDPSIDEFLARQPDRADELRKLLATARVMVSLADRTWSITPRTSRPSSSLPETHTLGDFRLLRELGRGGMGVVYEAEQISLGRRVALKVLPFAGVLDPRQLQRFQNEARAAATLDHHHIVHIHAVGQERGVHFYAMQLIEGQSLAEFLAERRAPASTPEPNTTPPLKSTAWHGKLSTVRPDEDRQYFRQVARWGIEAAEALDYAHQMGIVHRDIKPSNLLINSEGKLWVADFGLAMTRNDANLTMTGDLLGTLRYMSPEQVQGERSIIDQRTDVYSLGVTLYELLAFRPPFTSSNRTELLRQVKEVDPPQAPLSAKSVPMELQIIVLKATSKEPSSRYATAQALADDLRRYLNDQPITARRPTWRNRAVKWSRRHQTLVRSLLIAMVISICSAFGATILVLQERQKTDLERIARQAEVTAASNLRTIADNHEEVTRIQIADRAIHHGAFAEARRLLHEAGTEDSRGFEWHYLLSQAGSEVREVGRHDGTVYGMTLSPDGKLLGAYGQDGVRIWDLATDRQLRHLTSHLGDVNGAGFSPNGRFFATTGDDGTAKIHETETWTIVATLQHTGPAGGGGFTPDGKLYVTGEHDEFLRRGDEPPKEMVAAWPPERWTETPEGRSIGQNIIRVWETSAWTEQTVLRGHQNRLTCGDGSDDGRLMVTGDRNGVINLWQMPDGTIERALQHVDDAQFSHGVGSVDFAHRHSWFVTAGIVSLNLWDAQDGSRLTRLRSAGGGLRCVVFSPNDDYLLTGGGSGASGIIGVWRLTAVGTFEPVGELALPGGTVWSIKFLNEDEIVFSGDDGIVRRWQLPGRLRQISIRGEHHDKVCHAAFSPDARWLAYTSSGPGLVVRPMSDPDQAVSLDPHYFSDRPLAFTADGRFLAAARDATQVTIWNTETWELVRTYPPAGNTITRLQFQRENSRLLCAETISGYSWWNFPSGSIPSERHWGFDSASSPATERYLTFTPPGTWACNDGRALRWMRSLPPARFAQMSPDESLVVFARTDGSFEIVNAETGETISHCIGVRGLPERIAFSSDGRTLATCRQPQYEVTFWHIPTGRELLTMSPGFKLIRSLEFSSDGRWLVIAGQDLNGYGEVALIRGRENE